MPFRLQLKYLALCFLGLVLQQADYEDEQDDFSDDEGYPVKLDYGPTKSHWYDF